MRDPSSSPLKIRPEQPQDAADIRALIEAAFSASSYGLNNEPAIVDGLRESRALIISLVAELAAKLVGHVAVSPVEVSDGANDWFGLAPLSVLPDYQRRGIGAKLMQEALGALQRRGAQGCVLVGDPSYYGRFGFESTPGLVYPGIPDEYFLALKFGSSYPVGSVSYHGAFSTES